MGTYEVDGRLDVLDEGGGALVLGGRVAVQAAHVLRLPSGVGHDVLRPHRAAADETHHLGLPPPDQPRLRSAVASRRRRLSSSSPVSFCPLASPGRMRTREERREWVNLIGASVLVCSFSSFLARQARGRGRGAGAAGTNICGRMGAGVGPAHELSMRGARLLLLVGSPGRMRTTERGKGSYTDTADRRAD